MIILAHDFETTGLDTATCGVVQYAIGILGVTDDDEVHLLEKHVSLCNPGEPIPADCTKVHGITDADVVGANHYMSELGELYKQLFDKYDIAAVMGYNNREYDDRIARRCGMPKCHSLDLYDYGRELKDRKVIEKAKLTVLYAHFAKQPLSGAHDAWVDIDACIQLLPHLSVEFGHSTVAEMIEYTTPKVDLNIITSFGKHKGTPVGQLPSRYIKWLLNNTYHLPRDFVATLRAMRGE